MSRVRYSMGSLMLAVVLFAITFAVFRFYSDIWSHILFSVVLLMLFKSIVAAAYCTGIRRAFWTGFALFGVGYWLVANISWYGNHAISHSLAGYLYRELTPRIMTAVTPRNPPSAGGLSTPGGMSTSTALNELLTVCNCWVTLLFGIAGGFITRYIASVNARERLKHSTA